MTQTVTQNNHFKTKSRASFDKILNSNCHHFKLPKVKIYFHFKIIFQLPTVYASHTDRDIILTPNRTQHHVGKIIYFKPIDKGSPKQRSLKDNVHSIQVPWEEPLKHATYLVLNNKIDGNGDSR